MPRSRPLYRIDPNEIPRYPVGEVARYVGMPTTTVHNWVSGRQYSNAAGQQYWENLIERPDPSDQRLSFSNLLEVFVLNALRKQYRVKMREVRTALEYTKQQLGVDRVLLSKKLKVMQGNVFLEHLGKLINIGKGGQEAMPEILHAYLERIDFDPHGIPRRIFPLTREDFRNAPRLVTIDPTIAFGRPVVERKAIKTSTIAERFFVVGESIDEIADDFDLKAFEVEEAIRYEGNPIAA